MWGRSSAARPCRRGEDALHMRRGAAPAGGCRDVEATRRGGGRRGGELYWRGRLLARGLLHGEENRVAGPVDGEEKTARGRRGGGAGDPPAGKRSDGARTNTGERDGRQGQGGAARLTGVGGGDERRGREGAVRLCRRRGGDKRQGWEGAAPGDQPHGASTVGHRICVGTSPTGKTSPHRGLACGGEERRGASSAVERSGAGPRRCTRTREEVRGPRQFLPVRSHRARF